MLKSTIRLSLLSALSLLATSVLAAGTESAPKEVAGSTGPDVTVFDLPNTSNFGASNGMRGYSVGTTSCNVGTTPLNWCDEAGGCGQGTTSHDHPVIAQNIYKLQNGRMTQIGASWLKHGFLSLNQSQPTCGSGSCQNPPLGGSQLGVGCTDPYGSGLNGSRPLGRKSEVNPTTGAYPFPFTQGGDSGQGWNQRAAVPEADLIAAQNPGARYFVEGHYVAPDDAVSGNGLNNASYREVTVNQSTFNLSFVGNTVREKAAIEAWAAIDPTVELYQVSFRGASVEELFHVARKVTETAPGMWHYEYAVHNMNSARAADSFRVDFFATPTISGTGFHDVNAHSGEPYDTADWGATVSTNSVEWNAVPFAMPQNANAIRWGNTYNFWFDSSYPPSEIMGHTLGLFETGTPGEVVFATGTGVLFDDSFE